MEQLKAARSAVPQSATERRRLREAARRFVADRRLVPPLSLDDLEALAADLRRLAGAPEQHADFLAVLINNAAWRDAVAAVPFRRRTLLLPPCLRSPRCEGEFDEFGLLCRQCGACVIGGLQREAEGLGYAVLVAEGTSIVSTLIESGKVDAVIGVSCMDALERAFPYMTGSAVAGIAIPLLRDGCENTVADAAWIRRTLHLASGAAWKGRPDLDRLKADVASWFAPRALRAALGSDGTATEDVGVSWLARSGKRWRPFLTVCAFEALADGPFDGVPEPVRKVALAVECFHKASLVHDDIEDDDDLRYGRSTLHRAHGVPLALHAGNFLLVEGYRLIAECGAAPAPRAAMLAAAAEGHHALCLGQGKELCWARSPVPLSAAAVLDLYRLKTSPAFEVSLRLGAICAGADEGVARVLKGYSEALGVAYQIRDDLADEPVVGGGAGARPSIVPALAYEAAAGAQREVLREAWCGEAPPRRQDDVRRIHADLHVERRARALLEHHKARAIRALGPLRSHHLKALLYRLVDRILADPPEA
jgi:geranylgeranyl pyrophosphate synthase